MELKVKTPTFPEVIEFNFQELKQEITARASDYATLIYSEDQISDAKKDRATLNKFVKALSDERIKVKKECLKPYEDFEAKIKELDGIVSIAIQNIDSQVKAFEEKQRSEKLEAIKEYWQAKDKPFEIELARIIDARWLNASVSMKTIQEAIDADIELIENNVAALAKLPEYAFEALQVYKDTLDVTKALHEANRLAETAKQKAEYEKQKAEAEFAQYMNPPEEAPIPEQREWIGFKAYLTVADAQALANLFEARGIVFEQIEIN